MNEPRLCLLSRLTDDFPEERDPRDPDVAASELRLDCWDNWREGLRRDLLMLLTTLLPARRAEAKHARAAASVAFYGTEHSVAGDGQAEAILKAVEKFEPRFRDPSLQPSAARHEPNLICALRGWVLWNGKRRNLAVKVFADGQGREVGIYE